MGDSPDAILAGGADAHSVQFFDDDRFLVVSVRDFVETGLRRGEAAVVIATAAHRDAVAAALRDRGLEAAALEAEGRYLPLDAAATLESLLVEGRPDPALFDRKVGGLIRRARARFPGVVAYGEMVGLLWGRGDRLATLQLEGLWNELARTEKFSLLCGYHLESFGESAHELPFDDVCKAHSHVFPSEEYQELDGKEARRREVATLQRKAKALERELKWRRQAEAELEHREQALEAALSAREEFLAIASHELRTPLTALKLQAQLRRRQLERGDLERFAPDKLAELLAGDERQIDRLSRLVDDMLDLSRLQRGKLALELSRFDLCDLLRGMIERYSGRPVELEAHESAPGTWDSQRLSQAFTHLLDNALKYGDGKPVQVRLTRCDGRARVSVTDQGVGIPEADQERIFGRFERSNASTHVAGLGLGLYIARQIVGAHGGTTSVESRPGCGSTFTVDLPLC